MKDDGEICRQISIRTTEKIKKSKKIYKRNKNVIVKRDDE